MTPRYFPLLNDWEELLADTRTTEDDFLMELRDRLLELIKDEIANLTERQRIYLTGWLQGKTFDQIARENRVRIQAVWFGIYGNRRYRSGREPKPCGGAIRMITQRLDTNPEYRRIKEWAIERQKETAE